MRKDLEGICKSIYLCIRFRLISGAGKREAKRVLKDIERFENKQQVQEEAVSALTMLGFAAAPSQKVVLAILKEEPDAPVEKVIKLALKRL